MDSRFRGNDGLRFFQNLAAEGADYADFEF
jgi:hypothetical protein